MADTALAIQKAVIAMLAGIAAPGAESGPDVAVPVYDHPPEDAGYPRVMIEGGGETADDALDSTLSRHAIHLVVWTQYHGRRQIRSIMRAIYDRLHNSGPFAIESGQVISVRVPQQADRLEPDAITRQGTMTIEFVAADE